MIEGRAICDQIGEKTSEKEQCRGYNVTGNMAGERTFIDENLAHRRRKNMETETMRVKNDQFHLRIVMTLVKLYAGFLLLVWALPCQAAEQAVLQTAPHGAPQVIIQTNMGNIEVELNPGKAPNTVKNFLRYVEGNFYDGTIFHRVMYGFMIQGGGFTTDLDRKKPFDPIAIESHNGLKNDRGTIAMARTGDPNSATSQFFINTRDNYALNYSAPTMRGYGYTVFGKVISGMDVVDKIEVVNTATRGDMDDVPVKPVMIEKISVK